MSRMNIFFSQHALKQQVRRQMGALGGLLLTYCDGLLFIDWPLSHLEETKDNRKTERM